MTDKTEGLEVVAHEFQGRDGKWYSFIDKRHYENTVAEGSWPIRQLVDLASAQAAVASAYADYQNSMNHQNAMARQWKDRITQLEATLVLAREALRRFVNYPSVMTCNADYDIGSRAIAAIDALGLAKEAIDTTIKDTH